MPWETGPRGRPYYTRTRRENGRVIREYIGVGQEGQRAAEEDEARRRQDEPTAKRIGRSPKRSGVAVDRDGGGGLLPGHHGTWGGGVLGFTIRMRTPLRSGWAATAA